MIFKQLKQYRGSLSLVLMIIITGITQVLTLMKSSLVAGIFGTGVEIDAYNLANSIVSFLFGFIAAGISTVIIPNYVRKTDRRNVDSFIAVLYGVIALIVCILIAFRYQIIGIFSNRNELFINICCNALVVLLLANYLLAISDVTVAYFQCKGKYNLPKIVSLVAQLIVVVVLILSPSLSISQYTYIIAIGLVVNFGLDTLFAIKEGWRIRPSFSISLETKRMFGLFFPIVFSTGIYKLSLMVDSTIAARLETGEITVLSYASQISNIINTLLIGNLLTYYYPKIVRKTDTDNDQKSFWKQTILFHLIVCLVIAGFTTVGHETVMLLFQHGTFTEEAARLVYVGALIYIIGQQTEVVRDLIYRYFYAKGITSVAAKNGMVVSAVNISVSIILVYVIGFFGIFLGTIIASLVSLIMMFIKFHTYFGFENSFKTIFGSLLKNNCIVIITIIIVFILKKIVVIESLLLQILIFGTATLGIYLLFSVLFYKNFKEMIKMD